MIALESSVVEGSDQLHISVTIIEDCSITPAFATVARVGENYQLTGDMGKPTIKRAAYYLIETVMNSQGKFRFMKA